MGQNLKRPVVLVLGLFTKRKHLMGRSPSRKVVTLLPDCVIHYYHTIDDQNNNKNSDNL